MLEKEGFLDYLRTIIDNIDDSTTKGIGKLALDRGVEILSDRQKYTLEQGISDYIIEECDYCGDQISFEDMPFAIDNGKCSACNHSWERIENE